MSDAARLISFPRSMCTSFAWGNITLLPIIHHVDDIADERSSAKAHNRVLMECYSLCCDIGLKGCFKQKLNDINRPIRESGKGGGNVSEESWYLQDQKSNILSCTKIPEFPLGGV